MANKLFPFVNKGLVQKTEPGLLQDGEFQKLQNITSIQEGAISVRLGTQRFPNSQNFGNVHDLNKMAIDGSDVNDKRYIGDGTEIYRVDGPYSSYTHVSDSLVLDTSRWEAAPYHSGSGAVPTMYFAHRKRMMRDNGSFDRLRPWGISCPHVPALAVLADPSLTNFNGLFVLTDQSGGTDRLGIAITSATAVSGGYYHIVPASMANILRGMYVRISSLSGFVVVDQVDATGFLAFCPSAPSGSISSYYKPVNRDMNGNPVTSLTADGRFYYGDFAGSVDWSFGGDPATGYDSSDAIHFGVYVEWWPNVKEMHVQFFCDSSTTDYYEYTFSPDVNNEPAPGWKEYDIPKTQFAKKGNAGQGALSWKVITSCRVQIDTVSASGSFHVYVGAIYGLGGQGPDSISSAGAVPYQYAYTYRDPVYRSESNPSAEMIDAYAVSTRGRAVAVTCTGTSTDPIDGNPSITGYGSIAVYRKGGSFTDDEYRFLGYATNPGEGATIQFIDTFGDLDIATNQTADLDNYPPVPSDLPVPFQATVSGMSGASIRGYATFTFTGGPPGPVSQYLTPGSSVTIGTGDNQEIAIVHSSDSGSATLWIQYGHIVGDPVSCDVSIGQPCDLVCQYGDALVVAGDPNNPHKAYRSKAGRPSAFPVINLANGNSHVLNVGSPDNPIFGMTEINSELVFLNRTRIFSSRVWVGGVWTDVKEECRRGMVAKRAWCKRGEEIWFLSDDGIYSWGGAGEPIKRTTKLDWMFNPAGRTVGGISPVDYTQLTYVRLEAFENFVWFLYKDKTGSNKTLRYDVAEDRWEPIEVNSSGFTGSVTDLLYERDTGRLIGAMYDNRLGRAFLEQFEIGTSENWQGSPDTGTLIEFIARTGHYAPEGRNISKLIQDVLIELENPTDWVIVNCYYDFSTTADPIDSFTISSGPRRTVPLPLQQVSGFSNGKEAKTVQLEFTGSTPSGLSLYSAGFNYEVLTQVSRGRVTDWMDLGHPWDKRLYSVTFRYDTKGTSITLNMDTLNGVNGQTMNTAVQSFALTGSGQFTTELPINDGNICKMVRLRPSIPGADVLIWGWHFEFEKYPQDVIFFTEFDDVKYPFEKYFQQIVLDVDTNNTSVSVQLETENGNAETISVTGTQSNRKFKATLNPAIQARMMRLHVVSIPAGGKFQLFGKPLYIVQPFDKGPVSHSTGWDDLGHPWDKELVTCTIEYDGSAGTVIDLDTLEGVGGGTQVLARQQFVLSQSGHAKQTFAIHPGTVAKMVRLHPDGGTNPVNFKMWGYEFKKNEWPPDLVEFTPWNDYGYPHDKLVQEWAFDVDTGGALASVTIQADNQSLQTVSFSSTSSDRERIVTLNPALNGKKFRLLITPGASAKFQLFKEVPHFLRGDPGPVEHSFDWDDLGWPYDKRLKNVTFEYDFGGAGQVTMQMDTLSGIDGTTQNQPGLGPMFFTLTGGSRSKQTFPFSPDQFVKMIRFRPTSIPATSIKSWKYFIDFDKLPADKIPATSWDDMGWGCEKIVRGFSFDVDTGGVPASIDLQMDGATVWTFGVVSTSTDLHRIMTPPSNLTGRTFRLVPHPGANGKFQIMGPVNWDAIREPCPRTHWDSYELSFGQVGWKFIRQIWLEYMCPVQVVVSIYREQDVLFWKQTLPAHDHRDVENFKLPKVWNGALNKSRIYRITVDAIDGSNTLKFYVDSSRVETMLLGADMRAAYSQHVLSELTQPQTM